MIPGSNSDNLLNKTPRETGLGIPEDIQQSKTSQSSKVSWFGKIFRRGRDNKGHTNVANEKMQGKKASDKPLDKKITAAPKNIDAALKNIGGVDGYLNQLGSIYTLCNNENFDPHALETLMNDPNFVDATKNLDLLPKEQLDTNPKLREALNNWKEFKELLSTDPKDVERITTGTQGDAPKYTVNLNFSVQRTTGRNDEEIPKFEALFANWKCKAGGIHCNITTHHNASTGVLHFGYRDAGAGRPELELVGKHMTKNNVETIFVLAVEIPPNKRNQYNYLIETTTDITDEQRGKLKCIFKNDGKSEWDPEAGNFNDVISHMQKAVLQKVIQQEAEKKLNALK